MERPFAKRLAAAGFVAVPVSYRLGEAGRFPAALHDLKAAVRWLRAHAAEHGIDPARIGAIGSSAGGQLAALLGASNGVAALEGPAYDGRANPLEDSSAGRTGEPQPGTAATPVPSSAVQAVVDIDGLADFTDPALVAQQDVKPSAPTRFLGGSYAERSEAWRAASPITHVGPTSAPILFLDSTAPSPLLPGREAMAEKLRALGIDCEFVTRPGTPHTFWLLQPWFDDTVARTAAFLRRQLSATPPSWAAFVPGAVVAADGSGNYRSLQEAISAAPMRTGSADPRWVIAVKPGTYRERIYVQRERGRIAIVGEDAARTIVTYDLHAGVKGPDGLPIGTFRTPTVQIDGDGMIWENLTIANAAGPVGQAVALRVDADRVTFRRCRFLGWQDTILLNRGRHYFADCYIEGHVDFIFGAATAYFERCHIHCLKDGYVTAASTPEGAAHGFVFADCRVTGEPGVKAYLGRPWREFAATTFLRTEMSDVVRPEGWHNWGKPLAEKRARYAEFANTGTGSVTTSRAPWTKLLSTGAPGGLTSAAVLAGTDNWNPDPRPTLHLMGDSTMAEKSDTGLPERGWGQALRDWVHPPWRLVDHAANGRSTKSFRDQGHWATLLAQLQPGDCVVIQFGHNDEKQQSPDRYADPVTDYPANLRAFIAEVRARGATPVLATSIVRRAWNDDGTLQNSHGAYPDAVRAVAAAEQVPLLDLEALTRKLLVDLGPEGSKQLFMIYAPGAHPRLPEGKTDNTHLNVGGAPRIAALAVAEFRRLDLPFAASLVDPATPANSDHP
jgi:pectinesterase